MLNCFKRRPVLNLITRGSVSGLAGKLSKAVALPLRLIRNEKNTQARCLHDVMVFATASLSLLQLIVLELHRQLIHFAPQSHYHTCNQCDQSSKPVLRVCSINKAQ